VTASAGGGSEASRPAPGRGPLRSKVVRDLAVLAIVIAGAAGVAFHQQWLWRIDLAIYDAATALWRRPPPGDVVIVAIDEASLAAVGRWPWSRRVQAELLDRITAGAPRAVGLDIILSEPDLRDPAADRALALALARNGRSVLAVLAEGRPGELVLALPAAGLAQSAAGMGHTHVEVDPDGIVRSVYLREGPRAPDIAHLAAAMLAAAGELPAELPGMARGASLARAGHWQRDRWFRIPYAGPPGHVDRVSAGALLADPALAARLADKLVLVGATAAGLGDGYATPVSGASRLMPGVEINANILAALRTGIDIRNLPTGVGLAAAVLPVLATLIAYLWLAPRGALLLTAAVGALVMAFALAGPYALQLWFPPAATLAALGFAYPLWSWRRLEATLRYMREELARLRAEPDIGGVAASAAPRAGEFASDVIERNIDLVRAAAERVRSMRRFVAESLENQADGVLVCAPAGRIALANARAAALLGASPDALAGRGLRETLAAIDVGGADCDALLADPQGRAAPRVVEARTRSDRALLVSVAHWRAGGDATAGHIVNLTDVTALKQAENAREEALAFLSHDLRSPQSAILAAIELRRSAPETLTETALVARIEAGVRRTLALAEAFVTLARAEHVERAGFEAVDLAAIAREMADEAWERARAKGMRIEVAAEGEEALVLGDRSLLGAAIRNLVSNAIKFSPAGSTVRISVRPDGAMQACAVSDEGPGIAADRIATLFDRYRRGGSGETREVEGTGLGLAIVQAVARRHEGSVGVDRRPGSGATFVLRLPAIP